MSKKRNPSWHRDEILLALDLYFQLKPGEIHARNPAVIKLSEELNRLPLFIERPNEEKFRNPNGVALKLSNFLAIDDNYTGKGMKRGGALDKEIFDTFENRKQELHQIVQSIRNVSSNQKLVDQLYAIQDDPEVQEVQEGQVIYRLHKLYERNPTIVKRKKEQTLDTLGTLACEVCDFDFQKVYGELGRGFIECHHKVPLAKLNGNTQTRLHDLALVCSNCHRMLHRDIDRLGVEELRKYFHQS